MIDFPESSAIVIYSFVSNQEVVMSPLTLTFTFYFLLSSVIVALAAFAMKKNGDKLPFVKLLLLLLLSPVILGVMAVLHWIYPPSGDPFDLVYARLHFYEAKTIARIASEIKEAGQTVGGGWAEEMQVGGVLEAMVSLGFARQEKVVFKERLMATFKDLTEKYSGGGAGELEVDLVGVEQEVSEMDDDEFSVTLYLRGNPPTKRGKWQRRFLPRLRLAM